MEVSRQQCGTGPYRLSLKEKKPSYDFAFFFALLTTGGNMAANNDYDRLAYASQSRAIQFIGDSVLLSGQVDYPDAPAPPNGYPLVFIMHHAGSYTREDVQHYADLALTSGQMAFRWDKRGSGRSGASGRGSTLTDTVKAYETALAQPGVNRQRVVIVAQSDGTAMLRDMFPQLESVMRPHSVLLVANMLDKREVTKIKANVKIIMGDRDWLSWHLYGKEASETHKQATPYAASYSIIGNANRRLNDLRNGGNCFHPDAARIIADWLANVG
jgi:hypothetical protein